MHRSTVAQRMRINRLVYSAAVVVFSFCCIALRPSVVNAATVSSMVDFDATTDLTNLFNHDGSPVFTNISNGGINGSGSVNVPIPSNDLWTTKQGYAVTGAPGSVYTFSAYFLVAQNGGYGNLGFTNLAAASGDGFGQPSTGIGVNFHGGGGAFVNNGIQTILSWPPDLVLGNWYWFTFEVLAKGGSVFDLKLQIWNADSSGVVGSMKTEKILTNVTNTTLGSAPIIHAFFSAAGSRMSKVDNFAMDLEGSTFVSAGYPVVVSGDSATNIGATSASFGGVVTSDQGETVTTRGVCWATSLNPTLADTCSVNGSGIGSFSSSLTGLSPATTYYARSYATNSQGTSYGLSVVFTTQAAQNVSEDVGEVGDAGSSANQEELAATGTGFLLPLTTAGFAIVLGLIALRRAL